MRDRSLEEWREVLLAWHTKFDPRYFFSTLGVAALGSNYIAVGIHTGTIILFKVTSDTKSFICSVVDSQRCHINPISDLASTSIVLNESEGGGSKEILVSGEYIYVLKNTIW